MKLTIGLLFFSLLLLSCETESAQTSASLTPKPIVGTWQLVRGIVIEKGDTTVTEYTNHTSFIKIINETHFAFLQHDLRKGKDSAAVFSSGGGRYSLSDSLYTEHLDYCSAREWEGHTFAFTVAIQADTLVQQGIEQVETLGVNRVNIERYVRVKK